MEDIRLTLRFQEKELLFSLTGAFGTDAPDAEGNHKTTKSIGSGRLNTIEDVTGDKKGNLGRKVGKSCGFGSMG